MRFLILVLLIVFISTVIAVPLQFCNYFAPGCTDASFGECVGINSESCINSNSQSAIFHVNGLGVNYTIFLQNNCQGPYKTQFFPTLFACYNTSIASFIVSAAPTMMIPSIMILISLSLLFLSNITLTTTTRLHQIY